MEHSNVRVLVSRGLFCIAVVAAGSGLAQVAPAPAVQPKLKPAQASPAQAVELKKLALPNNVMIKAPTSPLFSPRLNTDPKAKLRGFVDMHTHPMVHLAFGGKVVHGAPGVGVLMPAGAIYNPAGVGLSGATCNNEPRRAANVAEALGSCYSSHAGHDLLKNKCGNHVRRLVLNGFEDGKHTNKPHDESHPQGYPAFTRWPRHDDILHQQMWVDWIERAYRGGLRVMVALTVNSYTLATGVEANAPTNDKDSGDLQLAELKRFVGQHKFMEIASSPEQLRRIVGKDDKLAIVLGAELDDMGDFLRNKSNPSETAFRQEIKRLHGLGVRYIFPVHVIDNHLGGTAVYEDEFNRANCFHYGKWWDLACASGSDGITHKVNAGWDVFKTIKLGDCGGTAPVKSCAKGHVNSRRLTAMGKAVIDEMMRLGMIIDIDHASQGTVQDILTHTGKGGLDYPLVSGHNGLRGSADSENSRTAAQYRELARRGGLAGVGWGEKDAKGWLSNVEAVKGTGVAIALGSDVNGLVKLPPPRAQCKTTPCVSYSDSFPQPKHQGRVWDYNKDGVAHVGLFPDLLRDVEGLGGQAIVNQLFDGAEAFAKTWESAVAKSKKVAPPPAPGMTVTEALYGRNCNIPVGTADIKRWVATQCDGTTACRYELTWAPWGGGDPNPSMCKKELTLAWRCPNGTTRKTSGMHERTPQAFDLSCR